MKKLITDLLLVLLIANVFISCGNNNKNKAVNSDSTNNAKAGIMKKDWGELDGKKVYLYTLTNKNGVQVKISNYGGTVTSWITPDNNGNKSSIIIGFDSLQMYLQKPPYFGA